MSVHARDRTVLTAGAERAAMPAAMAGTARFPASTDSNYITGQVILADGGMVLV
jgi:NAD(P)-dependent dehydrogenase (short-subunit alcohol dehydrogenase family)